jgi:hypothetical protein
MPDDLDQVTAPKNVEDHQRADPASSSPEPDVQGSESTWPVASHTRTLPGTAQLRSDAYCRTGISCQIPRVSITAR